ncbi:MAG: hypothetical protein M0Z63_10335 [Actinomycetota bacterium]|nr:hypothetical protein [Actinomycetota bacterium]
MSTSSQRAGPAALRPSARREATAGRVAERPDIERRAAPGDPASTSFPAGRPAAPAAAGSGASPRHRRWQSLAAFAGLAAGYLALSVGMWWHVWTGHPASSFLCACGDPGQYLWFFTAPAEALRHGHLPFFTGADYHPGGVNMLDNPGVLGLAVAVSPITWVFGPIAAVNVVLLVTPVLSALAGFALLRRWVRWWPAAALGGLLYGFSPFVVAGLEYVHLQAAFLAIPPLVLLCLDELMVRQRYRPVPVGIALGVLAAVQYLVSPEMVVLTALAALIGTILVVAYAARREPDELRRRAPIALRGIGTGSAVAVALLAYPVWYALEGPRHTVGAPWTFIAKTGNSIGAFVLPGQGATRQALQPGVFGYYGKAGPAQNYVGPTVLAAVVAVVVLMRRSRLVQFAAVMAAVLAVLSLGTVLVGKPGSFLSAAQHLPPAHWWMPWQLVAHLPLADEASPGRLSGILDLFVAIVCAAGLDRLVQLVRHRQNRDSTDLGSIDRGSVDRALWPRMRRFVPGATGLLAAVAVLVPMGATYQLPFATSSVQVPLWYRTAGTRLPAGSVVLAVPWGLSQTSAWQAISGMHFVMAGGDAFVPGPTGRFQAKPTPGSAEQILSAFTGYARPPLATTAAVGTLRRALARWQVTTVVVTETSGSPSYAVGFLSIALGSVPTVQDGAYVWSHVRDAPAPWQVPPTTVLGCRPLTDPPQAVAQCVARVAALDRLASHPATTG